MVLNSGQHEHVDRLQLRLPIFEHLAQQMGLWENIYYRGGHYASFEGKSQLKSSCQRTDYKHSSHLEFAVNFIDSGGNHSYMNCKIYYVVWQSVFKSAACVVPFVLYVSQIARHSFCPKLLSQSTGCFSKEEIIEEIQPPKHNILWIAQQC
jgi:hypothetical protein